MTSKKPQGRCTASRALLCLAMIAASTGCTSETQSIESRDGGTDASVDSGKMDPDPSSVDINTADPLILSTHSAQTVGEPVMFRGYSSNPSIKRWLWQYGDGTSASSLNPSPHVFDAVGQYTVTLRSYDERLRKQETASISIEVRPLTVPYFRPTQTGCRDASSKVFDAGLTPVLTTDYFTEEQAIALLRQADPKITLQEARESVTNPTPPCVVSPDSGSEISAGSTVVLTQLALLITTPDVVGLSERDATSGALRWIANTRRPVRVSDPAQVGIVQSQWPQAGEVAKPFVEIRIGSLEETTDPPRLSPVNASVPDLVGSYELLALVTLRRLGLLERTRFIETNLDHDHGNVLSQSPEAGTTVARGSAIIMDVGVLTFPVPDVIGLSEESARRVFSGIYLDTKVRFAKVSDPYEVGLVQLQSPPPGERIPPGRTVELVVGAAQQQP